MNLKKEIYSQRDLKTEYFKEVYATTIYMMKLRDILLLIIVHVRKAKELNMHDIE